MSSVFIGKVHYYLPDKIEENIKILLNSNKSLNDSKKIINKIGIVSKRISGKNEFSSDLAIKAAKKILNNYNKEYIDFLIYCTNTPDYLLPTNACVIHEQLKLRDDCGAFDITLACSGYLYSLAVANSLIKSKQAKNILLITSDTYSKFIPIKDTKNRVLFGDGSTACIISSNKKIGGIEILKFLQGTQGSNFNYAIIKNFGNKYRKSKVKNDNYLSLDGPGLYNFALEIVPKNVRKFLKSCNLSIKNIDHFVFHQANKFMIEGLIRVMGLEKRKVFIDMKKTGNTTSSSIPIILKKKEKSFKQNSKILMVAFGGGLSWSICLAKKT